MSNRLNAFASGTQTLSSVSPRPACSHRQCYLFCAYTSFDHCWASVFVVFNATFNNIFVISWVSFIGGGNRRKPPTCRKSLTKNLVT